MGCGICGFVGLSDKHLLQSMCEAIRHRGPDDTGYYVGDSVGLGTDRLQVIGVSTGHQPIHNEDESCWVTYNGEIYNYRELRETLEKCGHAFYTDTDTETIVHAYEEWGLNFVSHLSGMFAFGLWDSNRKRLVLARDRFGKKPLYYMLDGGILLFASEIKSLIQYEGFQRQMNFEALDHFLAFGYVPSPMTIFGSCYKLPPAHYAVYEGGRLSSARYWDMNFASGDLLDEGESVGALYAALEGAVRARLQSEVPLGAFLSGGIDSSTVVSIMQKLSDVPVKTVSVGFDDSMSELKYARQVAEYLGTDHQEFVVTPNAYEILPKLIWHFDEPFADHSMIPTYYLSETTRKFVTVALSGDGGDEMFMGYNFLTDPAIYNVYSKVPPTIRRLGLRAVDALPFKGEYTRMAHHAYEKDYGSQSPAERYVMRSSVIDDSGLKRLYSSGYLASRSEPDTKSYLLSLIDSKRGASLIDAIDYATIRSYLEEDILVKVDRMSMAVSLEPRCPMLDQNLASVVERIPADLKMKGRIGKYILKKMVIERDLIPKNIALRKKQGFGVPMFNWMRGEWRSLAGQALDGVIESNYTGLFDREYVRKLLREPYQNANKLFALVVFVTWHRMYIDQEKSSQIAGQVGNLVH